MSKIPSNTIIVDEGEFATSSVDRPLATWGVTQCIVIYIRTTTQHSLAHVDTRTEKWSLGLVFNSLTDISGITILLIGARGDESILDSPRMNKEKVESYLRNNKYTFQWLNQQLNTIIVGDQVAQPPYYVESIAIPQKCSGKQLMLQGPFYGSFPLTETQYDNKILYLNERLTFQLLNIHNVLERFDLITSKALRENCDLYANRLITMRNNVITSLSNNFPNVQYLSNVYVIVPDETLDLNSQLVSTLNTENTWWSKENLVNVDRSKATIDNFILFLQNKAKARISETFPTQCIRDTVIDKLQKQNQDFATFLAFNILDTFTGLKDIFSSIKTCSIKIWQALALDFMGFDYFSTEVTVAQFKKFIREVFGSSVEDKLQCFIRHYNKQIQNNDLNIDQDFLYTLYTSPLPKIAKRDFVSYRNALKTCIDDAKTKDCTISINIPESIKTLVQSLIENVESSAQSNMLAKFIDDNRVINSFSNPGKAMYRYIQQLKNIDTIEPLSWIGVFTDVPYVQDTNEICVEFPGSCQECNMGVWEKLWNFQCSDNDESINGID